LTTKEKTSVFDSIDIFIKLYKKIHKKFNKQIDLMGDSAGGNLILVLAQQLKLKKIHAPRNIIAISPVVNFNINLREIKHSLEKEAILPYSFIKLIQENYVGDLNPKLPIFSPLYGDCSYLAKKIWLFYGEDEGMSIDGEKFYSKAKHAGQKIFLNIKSEMFHIYPIFNIKEAKDTNKLIVDIIKFK
jgi:acetyl esterase/lipase